MEDKRTLIAVVLSFIVIFTYSELILSPKMRAAAPTATTEVTSPQVSSESSTAANGTAIQNTGSSSTAQTVPAVAAVGHPTVEELNNAPETTLITSNAIIKLSHLGARIRSYTLSQFKDHVGDDTPLDMVYHTDKALLPGGIYAGTLSDERVLYTLTASTGFDRTSSTITIPAGGEASLTFTGTLGSNGPTVTKTYRFGPQPYLFAIDVALDKPISDVSRVWLEWALHLDEKNLKEKVNPNGYTALTKDSSLTHVALADVTATAAEQGTNRWLAINNKYFMAALVPALTEKNSRIGKDGSVYYARVSAEPTGGTFSVYVGPKQTEVLHNAGFDLHRSIDLGWFAPVSYPLLVAIRFFYKIFGNYGLAIILLTLLIKALFLPLTKASFNSMRKMQDIAPEMKELRERIKDPTELNRAVLDLYKRRGVNPMGGCFPILIQLPVFLGLYNALLYSIELRHAPFALWINDLSTPEGLTVAGISIPVMVLIMGASMYYQQATSPQIGDPQQQKMMKFMPIIFTGMFIVFPMPAGLVLYWLVNNTISIIQQVYLRSDKKANAYVGTGIASVVIFAFGYILTLLG
jgi:YidC/Oxa1 family membrane protein insertase